MPTINASVDSQSTEIDRCSIEVSGDSVNSETTQATQSRTNKPTEHSIQHEAKQWSLLFALLRQTMPKEPPLCIKVKQGKQKMQGLTESHSEHAKR